LDLLYFGNPRQKIGKIDPQHYFCEFEQGLNFQSDRQIEQNCLSLQKLTIKFCLIYFSENTRVVDLDFGKFSVITTRFDFFKSFKD